MCDINESTAKALEPDSSFHEAESSQSESQTYTWEITNFTTTPGSEVRDTSYFFSSNEQKFFLRLYPQFEIKHLLNHVAVYLHRGPPYTEELKVVYKISIIDHKGEKCYLQEIATDFNDKCKGVAANGGMYYISREYLLDRKNGLLQNDKLTIFCEVEFLGNAKSKDDIFEPKVEPKKLSSENQKVIDILDTLLDDGKFADLVLVVGEREFKVHKAILAARSEVFASMFENEIYENRIEVADVLVEVMNEALRYIYTGAVPSLEQYAPELFIVSDKYKLESLKSIIEQYICTCLEIECVVEILELAETYSSAKLKNAAIEYITANASQVMLTDGWAMMGKRRPELLLQLYRDLVVKKCCNILQKYNVNSEIMSSLTIILSYNHQSISHYTVITV